MPHGEGLPGFSLWGIVKHYLEDLQEQIDGITPGGGTEFDFGAQYVHPDGADSSTGFSPSTPKATIEAAVGDLGTEGGTVILAAKQQHDVGDGLALDRQATICFRGVGRARRDRGSATRPPNGPVIYSSTGAATLIDLTEPVTSVNTYGWEFDSIDFQVSPTTTRVFELPSVNNMRVVNCGFSHPPGDLVQAPFQVIHAFNGTEAVGDDSSWFRVVDNYVRGGQLVHVTGYGANQWIVKDNLVFPINQTDPCIYMENGHRMVIRDNNLEGSLTTAGIYLKGITSSRIDGNGGEATDPFIILENSHGNMISDMGIITPGDRVLLQLLGSSGNNVVLCSVVTALFGMYNENWLDDQTGADDNWFIVPSTSKARALISLSGLKIKSGSPVGVVRGKAGDKFVQYDSTAPPFDWYKISDDGGTSGWRQVSFDAADSAGAGFRALRGPNT